MTSSPGSAAPGPRRTPQVRCPDWAAVIALKRSAVAKSRLAALPAPLRQRIAEAMAWDTLAVLQQVVGTVMVVGDDPNLPDLLRRHGIRAEIVAEPAPAGMNAALRTGDELLRARGHTAVLACVGDLPALTADDLQRVLQAAGDHGAPQRFLVADHTGVGTTMLLADGMRLDPRFQGASAQAHRDSGAIPLTGVSSAGLRRDVDSVEDLAAVCRLGVGPSTAALLDPATGAVASYRAITVAADDAHDDTAKAITGDVPVITDTGVRLRLPDRARDPRLRRLRAGQRLHAAAVGDRLVAAWL